MLRFFDGTFSYVDPIFNDTGLSNIPGVLFAAQTFDDTKEALSLLVARDANITEDSAVSWITRMFIPVGVPLEGFSSVKDQQEDQEYVKIDL